MYGATEATARMAYLPTELAFRPALYRCAHPGRRVPHRADGRRQGRRRRVGVPRTQRHDGLREHTARPRPRSPRRRTPHRRHRPQAPTGCTKCSPAVADSSRCTDCASTFSTSRSRCAHAACPRSAPTTTASVVAAAGSPRRRDVHRCRGRAAGLPGAVVRVAVDELPLLPSGKPDYRAVRGSHAARPVTSAVARPAWRFRRCAAGRPRHHRPRCQLRRPRRQLPVLRHHDGAAGTGDRPAAHGLAAACRCGSWSDLEAGAPQLAGDAGDQRRAARRRDRARSSDRTPSCSSCGAARTCC